MDGRDFQETYPYQGFPSSGAAIGLRRLVARTLVLALALGAIDMTVAERWPEPDPSADGRMPRALPTSALASFVRHIERGPRPRGHQTVAFIGASPAWGDAVRDDSQTVPAWFRKACAERGARTTVYNLACNGQLMGDSYFIARRVADDVDVVVVQLTYHAFNPEWRQNAAQHYPEIPRLLGVPVDPESARLLGCDASPRVDVLGSVDRWLQAHWRLYGARDRIVASGVGSTPESALFERWQELTVPEFGGERAHVSAGVPFDELSPDEQMLVMDEFSSAGIFDIDTSDTEVRMLVRLCDYLESTGQSAVFYVSPVNVEALESFDLFDQSQYASNVSVLRGLVEARGHRFVDTNAETRLPSSAFADINHTTAEGSRQLASELVRSVPLDGYKP